MKAKLDDFKRVSKAPKAYSVPYHTSKMECFMKNVNSF